MTTLQSLFLASVAGFTMTSCLVLELPGNGPRGRTISSSVGVYDELPRSYVGDAYLYQNRYYYGGRYESGVFHDHGRQYSDRYYHGGQYYYGGNHQHHEGSVQPQKNKKSSHDKDRDHDHR